MQTDLNRKKRIAFNAIDLGPLANGDALHDVGGPLSGIEFHFVQRLRWQQTATRDAFKERCECVSSCDAARTHAKVRVASQQGKDRLIVEESQAHRPARYP